MDEHENEDELVSAALARASEPGRSAASSIDLAPVLREGMRRRHVASRRKRAAAAAGAAAVVIGVFLAPLPHLHIGAAPTPAQHHSAPPPGGLDKFALLVATDGGFTAFSPTTGRVLERTAAQLPSGWEGATLQGFAGTPGSPYLYATYLVGSRSKLDQGSTIVRIALRGGAVTVLGAGSSVALSPDGRQLAWLTSPDDGARSIVLVVRDLATGTQRTYPLPRITPGSAGWGAAAFAPDDKGVVVALEGLTTGPRFAELALIGPSSGGARFLDLSPKADQTLGGSVTSVGWLPDGRTLVIGAANCVDPAAQCPFIRAGPALAEVDTLSGALEDDASLPLSTVSSVAVCPGNGDIAVAASTWPRGSAYGEQYVKVLGGVQVDLGTSDLPFVQWVAVQSLATTAVPTGHVLMPDVVGLPATEAGAVLAHLGLTWRYQDEGSYIWSPGTVVGTAPAAGSELDAGSKVTAVVSAGLTQSGPATTTTAGPSGR